MLRSYRATGERLLDTRMADGVTRPGFFPQLAHRLGARSFDFDTPDLRMSTLLASDSDLGHAFSDAWALLREEVDGVVDVTQSPGLLSHPAETVPAQHRMQHAITAQREAAAARRLDVLMLALPRTDPRRHAWLEAGDAAQIAGRWLASHPSERLGLVGEKGGFAGDGLEVGHGRRTGGLDAVIVDGVFVHVVVEDGAGEVGEAVDVGGP